MLSLYLVCLIIGGALVALSLFGGTDVDADADVAFDADVDVDADVDADTDVDASHGEGVAAAARFLSLRSAVFFTAFFGLTGTLLTVLGIGVLLTPVFAVAVGLVAACVIHRLMDYLMRNETGLLPDSHSLKGALAAVVVDIDEAASGKIAVKGGDRTLQLVARVHEGAESKRFRAGEEVVIIDFDDGIAQVAGTRFLA